MRMQRQGGLQEQGPWEENEEEPWFLNRGGERQISNVSRNYYLIANKHGELCFNVSFEELKSKGGNLPCATWQLEHLPQQQALILSVSRCC